MTKKEIWNLCKIKIRFNLKCDLCRCDLLNKDVIRIDTNLEYDNYLILICEKCFIGNVINKDNKKIDNVQWM